MKRIAIFCDGTWNSSDAEFQTNVVKLSLAVAHHDENGVSQQLLYMPGVGSGRGATGLARHIDRWGGGLFGWGMTENIEEAYRNLAFSFESGSKDWPSDEIFVFGFSRGAFTARSLCGLIRSCGIPCRENVKRIPEAIARYRSRDRDTHPDHEESFRFRRDFSTGLYTSEPEREWREAQGDTDAKALNITYLGVWDTVGALGVPRVLPFAPHFNRRYQFHDAALSRSVLSARHAVAIDERRVTYPPTLWDNLEALNDMQPERDRPYRQEWFPGDHGSVGGGGDILGLATSSLLWIAEGAIEAGLWIDSSVLDSIRKDADFTAPLSARSVRRAGLGTVLGKWTSDRTGPKHAIDVSECARQRWRHQSVPPYRPATLAAVAAELDASASSPSGGA
jgi:uncharacterized protein (DUF2235 family)